jgi:hypothetical protein
MSRRKSASSSAPAPAYRKPRANVYTLLLFVALVCLIVGTVFLFLETKEYGPNPFSGLTPKGGAAADAWRMPSALCMRDTGGDSSRL